MMKAERPSGEEGRQGRRLLGWSMDELAYTSGVSRDAISDYELGKAVPRPVTLAAILGALEAAGVEFTEDGAHLKPEALRGKGS